MSSARPDSEAARRGGLVPFTGSSNGRDGSNNGPVNNSARINANKAGNFSAGNPAPENGKTSAKGGNNQLWSNGSGTYTQGSAPVWPENGQQGAPAGPNGYQGNNFDNRQTGGPGSVGGGYLQPHQAAATGGPGLQQQQQQQQQSNWRGRDEQQGVPVNPQAQSNVQNGQQWGGYVQGPPASNGSGTQPNWQNNQQWGGPAQGPPASNGSHARGNSQGPEAGYITPGPPKGHVPKGDYVYYDDSGKQIHPGAPPPGAIGSKHLTASGREKHFHHHYYYNNQQPQQPAPVGYPYDKKLEEKKKRRKGANALAAALIACWACTCCCHAPCGC